MKIYFESLGCDKNLVNSEHMLGILRDNSFEITNDEYEADIAVVNTCCFIGDAKEESIMEALRLAALKEEGELKLLVLCGCLAQRYKEEIFKELPEVDVVVGTSAYEDIANAINEALKLIEDNEGCKDSSTNSKNVLRIKDINYLPQDKTKRLITTNGYTSYLKIAEGCDKHCTYCIIPSLRGKFRSVPMERLLEEASYLVENGTKELILVAQETTLYGKDLYGEKSLHKLLRELSKIEGLHWIRILYCYPEEIYDELIEEIRTNPKVVHYLDIPIQHGNDKVLSRMGRRTSKQDIIDIITKLREKIPDIVIRTTLITGFPGEGEEEFEDLLDFVYDMSFERLGVFTYSQEEDTPAAKYSNQVEENVKEARKDAVMEMQQDIAFDNASLMVGKDLEVIIEGYMSDGDIYVARSYMDAPDIDGYVFVKADRMIVSGSFAKVRITDYEGYDLVGEFVCLL